MNDFRKSFAAGHQRSSPTHDNETGKDRALISKIEVRGIRRFAARRSVGAQVNSDEVFRVLDRQRTQPDFVNDTEDGGIRSNPQRQRQDSDGGEAGISPQHPQAKLKVLPKCSHERTSFFIFLPF
jgi:hypothetical protein